MNIRTSAFRRLAILSLGALAMGACDDKTTTVLPPLNPVVTITPSSATLQVGQTTTFVTSVADDTTGANSGVTYSSSNQAVATVTSAGVVTAVAPGTATIIATSKFRPTAQAAAQVIVVPVVSNVIISLSPSSAPLVAGNTLQLVAAVSGTSNTAVTYSTSDQTVATVSSTGLVTAQNKNGTAVITASSVADPTKTATSVITVSGGAIGGPIGITIAPAAQTVEIGSSVTFTANVTGTTNTAKTFSSSDVTVATVNATTGVATATNKPGTAIITATSTADPTKTASATLTVTRQTVVVTASPQVFTITPQGTQTITPSVSGSTPDINAGVTCVSSNTNVATVTSPGCVVTGVATGTATITVTSVGDPTKSTQVTVTVAALTPTSISIESVTQQVGAVTTAVVPGQTVTGPITVRMNVTAGTAASIQRVAVRLGGVEACTQPFSPPLQPTPNPTPINCTFNTAQLNPTNGTAVFPNGTYLLTADAFSTADATTPAATATFGNIVLNNTNSVNGVVTYDNSLVDNDNLASANNAVDGAGVIWNGGTATVTVTPAVFTGTPISTIDIIMDVGCNGADVTKNVAVGSNGSATAIFSEADLVAAGGNDDVSSMTVCYQAGNAQAANTTPVTLPAGSGTGDVSTSGTALPAAADPVDNVPPVALTTTFSAAFTGASQNSFAGNNTTFSTTSPALATATTTDAGVGAAPGGVVTYAFYAVPASTATGTTTELRTAVTGQTAVTGATTLTGSVSNNAYKLIQTAQDKLGNITYKLVGTFGVDLVAPTVRQDPNATSAPNNGTNPADELNMEARDSISGLQAIRARIYGRTVNGTNTVTTRCYDNTGAEVANSTNGLMGSTATVTCPSFDVATVGSSVGTATVNIPTVNNFYTIEVQGLDRAGNLSAVQTYNELVDTTVPSATVTSNTTTTTGTSTTVSIVGDVKDNVDLAGYDLRFRFPTVTTVPTDIPFSQMTQVSTYGLPLVGLVSGATGSNTALPIREINEGGVTNVPTAFGFGALDVAGNYGASGFAATTAAVGNGISNLNSFQIAESNATICRTGTNPPCASTGTTSTTITATINTTPAAADPISTVLFYYVHAGADNTIGTADDYLGLISQVPGATAPTQTGVSDRLYTVTQTLSASMLPNAGPYRVVAIGVDSQGDAILSNVLPLTVQ